MKSIETQLADLDDWLASEIEAFESSAESARAKQLPKFEIHNRAVAEAYRTVRSWLHVNVLQSRLAPGDVLTVYLIEKIRQGVPEELEKRLREE